MKKLLKIFLSLVVLVLLFIGTWFGVNLWPRKMEPQLWTEADLAMPEEKDKNGYYFLVQMKGNPALEGAALTFPDDLAYEDLVKAVGDPASLPAYWEQVKKLEPALSNFVQKQGAALQEYQKLLDFPQFVDMKPLSFEGTEPNWLQLLDLHKVSAAFMIQKMIEGNPDAAYSLWQKQFRMDQSWLTSARGIIFHMIAISDLELDLNLLSILRGTPPSQGDLEIVQGLENFAPEKISFQRALITEYLLDLSLARSLSMGKAPSETIWYRAVFNQSIYRRDTNAYFRRLEAFLQHPQTLTNPTIAQFEQERKDLRKGPFWWFFNPAGKLISQLVATNIPDEMQDFYIYKQKIIQLRSQLLAGPLFPPPPETQSTETQIQESQKGPETSPESSRQPPPLP